MKVSISKENHLKTIFHLQQEQGLVTTNALAAALNTRPASVTDMLKKLKEQKLLIYERYKGFKLNNEGRKAALQIIRKHRLWEYFLVKKLQFGWDEVHEIAEELEHISSRELIDIERDYDFNAPAPFDQPGYPKMHFIEHRYARDETNWWVPNRACVEAMLRSSGFAIEP